MGVFQNVQKFRVRVSSLYITYRKSSTYCGPGVQNSQKFRSGIQTNVVPVPRVLCIRAYITYRSSGYGGEGRAERTDVPGTGIKPYQNSRKFRVLWHGGKELTEVTGRYTNGVPVPRVL